MIDEIMNECDDDEECSENAAIAARKEHPPSLMSMLGLKVGFNQTFSK